MFAEHAQAVIGVDLDERLVCTLATTTVRFNGVVAVEGDKVVLYIPAAGCVSAAVGSLTLAM